MKYRSEGGSIGFMGKTCIHGSHAVPFSWDDSISGQFSLVCIEQRLIISHADKISFLTRTSVLDPISNP